MRWGLDAAYCPDADLLFRQKADGWDFYCGYIGGHAANVWSPGEWQRVASLGFLLLPIYVAPLRDDPGHEQGVNDGNNAVMLMQALGFSGTVALDVESGRTPREYSTGFIEACTAGDLGVVLYGTPETIRGIGDLPWLQWWVAWWPAPGLRYQAAPPDWAMWQVADGPECDYDVAVEGFPWALLEDPSVPSALPTAEA